MKPSLSKKKSAFSFIELSIVILIIGIAIAGVVQGSRMVRSSKLSAARALTQNSPVASIKSLFLWLDVTGSTSFSFAQTEDETTFQTSTGGGKWYDINPQTTKPTHFNANSNSITYKESGINGLPTISFHRDEIDVTDSGFSLINSAYALEIPPILGDPIIFSGESIISPYNAYTVFSVSRAKESGYIFYNGDVTAPNGFGMMVNAGFQHIFSDGGTHSSITGSLSGTDNIAEVTTMTLSPSVDYGITVAQTLKIWRNGELDATQTLASPNAIIRPDTNFYVGSIDGDGNDAFTGDISEVIVYGRQLTDKERKAVESYLIKKYDIRT